MEEDKGLLEVVHRMVRDEGFRARIVSAPRQTLMTELGISSETLDALRALAPVLLLGIGIVIDPSGKIQPDWGGWGAP